jgi:hypothetical protein
MRGSVAVLVAGLLLPGCSIMQTHEQRAAKIEPLLAASGFQAVPASTPDQLARLQKLPALTLQESTRGGKPHFWYADPYRCKCLYTGTQAQYDKYEALRMKLEIAKENKAAAVDDEDAASIDEQMDWFLPWQGAMWSEPWWGPPAVVANGAEVAAPEMEEP